MSEVVVVASLKVQSGKEQEALAALTQMVEATHANDSGCVKYALHRSNDDPAQYIFVERWDSQADLHAHSKANQERGGPLGGLLAEPPVIWRATPLEAGDAAKGVI